MSSNQNNNNQNKGGGGKGGGGGGGKGDKGGGNNKDKGKGGKDNTNYKQAHENTLKLLEKVENKAKNDAEELRKLKEKAGPTGALDAAEHRGDILQDMTDLEVTEKDLEFENADIVTAYSDMVKAARNVQNDILKANVEGEAKKLKSSMDGEALRLQNDMILFDELTERIKSNVNHTVLVYKRAQKLLEDGIGRDVRTTKEFKSIIEAFDRYVELTAAENSRLRNLNALSFKDVKTVSGGNCLSIPQYNLATNRYECLAHAIIKEASFLGFGPESEKVVKKLDEVSRFEFDNFMKAREEFDKRNKFGGLEGNRFVAPAQNFSVDNKYVLMTQLVVAVEEINSQRVSNIPIPVGTELSFRSDSSHTSGKKVFRINPTSVNKKLKDLTSRYNLDYNGLLRKDIVVGPKDVYELLQ
jgi:hypothetical protein